MNRVELKNLGFILVYDPKSRARYKVDELMMLNDIFMVTENETDIHADLTLNHNFWDCECSEKYINYKKITVCPVCNCLQEDMPNSRQNEIEMQYKLGRIRY